MKRQSNGLLYALLSLLLFVTLASQVPFTIEVVRALARGTLRLSSAANQGALFPVLCFLVLPWLSIPLGFWVAAVRPRDFRAWLVLGILLGMSQLVRTSAIAAHPSLAVITFSALIFRDLAERAWPACMMLFGLYFPQ